MWLGLGDLANNYINIFQFPKCLLIFNSELTNTNRNNNNNRKKMIIIIFLKRTNKINK